MGAVMSVSEKMGKRFCCLNSSTTLSRLKSSNDATRHVEILMEGYIQKIKMRKCGRGERRVARRHKIKRVLR